MSRALSTLAIASITGRHTPIVSVYGLAGAAFGFTIDWFSHSRGTSANLFVSGITK